MSSMQELLRYAIATLQLCVFLAHLLFPMNHAWAQPANAGAAGLFKLLEHAHPSYDLLIGFDTWDLHPSVDRDTSSNPNSNTRLFLANSTPYWPYQNPAPWIKYRGTLHFHSGTTLSVKYRRDQSSGSRLDELSLDQAYHGVGVRLGVLDYKTSWCRTYEVDSPWVRENDPFCTVRTASQPISAAPGLQGYANAELGGFKLQAIAGAYSPLRLNYAPKEFTNTVINDLSQVTQNDKIGIAFNAIQLETGLDLRLSFLSTDQYADYRIQLSDPTYRIHQKTDVVYAGLSFNPVAPLTVRMTQLQSKLQGMSFYPAGYVLKDDTTAEVFYRDFSPKTSSVLEMNYQIGARDVVSFAHSIYDLDTDTILYRYAIPSFSLQTLSNPGQFVSRTTNTSLSWRRDWQKGLYTVIQWSAAQFKSSTNLSAFGSEPTQESSDGTAVGLRVGYRF